MKLGHYLLLGLAVMFAAILVGAQIIYVDDTRDYLEQQLEAHAQETATSLALAIGGAGRPADLTLAETLVRPVFDRGQFKRIKVLDTSGRAGVPMALDAGASGAPDWFVRLFPIDAPGGEALISSGWQQFGRVTVEPSPTLAYRHLWQVATTSTLWLGALFFIALGVSRLLLGYLLRSLSEIESAAGDLGNRIFREIKLVPRARELQNVVSAFNLLSGKIRSALEFEETRAQQLQREAFSDGLTGLLNRRGLAQQVQILGEPGSASPRGAFALFAVDGLASLRAQAGFQRVEDLLRESAEILRDAAVERPLRAAYVNEGTFALLLPGVSRGAAENDIAAILRRMSAAAGRTGVVELGIHVGAVYFNTLGQDLGRLLGEADIALERARHRGDAASELVTANETAPGVARGSQEWRALIQRCLDEDRLALLLQRVVSLPARTLMHREVTVRLDEAGGQLVPARLFFPMALRHHLGAKLDAAVLAKVFTHLHGDTTTDSVAVNVSAQTLSDANYLQQLKTNLTNAPTLAKRLIFEIAEATMLEQAAAVYAFAQTVRAYGCSIGLDNFMVSGDSLNHLRELLPAYVKLATSYSPESGEQASFVISSLGRITRPLDVRLIVLGIEREETLLTLADLAVDGAQGYAIDRPSPWQ